MKIFKDRETGSLMFVLKEGEEDYYEEMSPGVNVEFNKAGEPIGIEVQNAYKPYTKKKTSKSTCDIKKYFRVESENSLPLQAVYTKFYIT